MSCATTMASSSGPSGIDELRLQRHDRRHGEQRGGDERARVRRAAAAAATTPRARRGRRRAATAAGRSRSRPTRLARAARRRHLQPVDADGAEGEALAHRSARRCRSPRSSMPRVLSRVDDLGAVDGRQREEARQVGDERQRRGAPRRRGAAARRARRSGARTRAPAVPACSGKTLMRARRSLGSIDTATGARGLDTDSAVGRLRKPTRASAEGGDDVGRRQGTRRQRARG